MKILAFDASSPQISIAMIDYDSSCKEHHLLYYRNKIQERVHSSTFFSGLKEAMTNGKPELLVVGIGPGSYNGLRSSIAAAQAIASSLNINLVTLSSLLAFKGPTSGYWVCGDARGGDYWLAAVAEHRFLEEPFLLPPSALLKHLAKYCDFPLLTTTPLASVSSEQKVEISAPDALQLALLGVDVPPSEKRVEPLYLKPPSITMSKQGAL